jgi:hypothetical protein
MKELVWNVSMFRPCKDILVKKPRGQQHQSTSGERAGLERNIYVVGETMNVKEITRKMWRRKKIYDSIIMQAL